MSPLKPWTFGPFELLLHAETHMRDGADMDRRIAMISLDNAIEVSISTYLQLNPRLRGNRQYERTKVERWLQNYHTKLEFLESEIASRGGDTVVAHDEIIWFHDLRNDQYHGGRAGIPEEHNLQGIRKAALWIFSFLFEIDEIEMLLDEEIANRRTGEYQEAAVDDDVDNYLDDICGAIEIAGSTYRPGEILRAVDPVTYMTLRDDFIPVADETEESDGNEATESISSE